ncbi:MAG: PVC-type heme-binding CxxCH protein [Planctomycetaceae bacterium]
MKRRSPPILLLLATVFTFGLGVDPVRAQEDPFAAGVRVTPHLPPEQEQKSFRLPEGFEIELVASEPQIQKPLNMAFDARGRLWITDTIEYPYAAKDRPGRDSIKVLEDTNGDGKADRITTFADGLNIPIGIYPYKNGVIAFSIPYIWWLEDTDGDGKADKRDVLYGPMGVDRDTHGMNNAFRRGFDGWLYACHGFSNDTTVKGRDGNVVHMNSGNTYRMRLDGERVEHFTWGQVNPFGMTFDPLGNLFTADCHSKPIYQLLRGGYYPSFGKPDDGLGFVPPMMEHGHGSTAICGISFYTGENFPPAFRGNLFTGNVMTSRINRDTLKYNGSTILAQEEPDFLSTTDPWFRPVDIQLGPDDALYVADFYNRIIGHYEVPLEHPGRDRTSGRIWRIVYRGKDAKPLHPIADLSAMPLEELIPILGDPNLTRRTLAVDQITDRIGKEAVEPLRTAFRKPINSQQRLHALWTLYRFEAATDDELAVAAVDPDREVRIHAMKVLSEIAKWSPLDRELALKGLSDSDAFTRRAAADALGRHPQYENVRPLLDALKTVPPEDNHLVHTIRMALRDQLRDAKSYDQLATAVLGVADLRTIAGVSVSLPTPAAATFLLRYVQTSSDEPKMVAGYLQHMARHLPLESTDALADVTRRKFQDDVDFQMNLLGAIRSGLEQRGAKPSAIMKEWGAALASSLFDSVESEKLAWFNTALEGKRKSDNPWVLQRRISSDGTRDGRFLCSLPRGEQLTGVLRSASFEVPAKISFYVAGHDGPPEKPAAGNNVVRLRDSSTHAILAETFPPRNDVAQKFEWDLPAYAGRRGYVEIVDADDRGGYAWLAVGRFEPASIALPKADPSAVSRRLQEGAEIVASLELRDLAPKVADRLTSGDVDSPTRESLGRALVRLKPDARLDALVPVLGDGTISSDLYDIVAHSIVKRDESQVDKALSESFRACPQRLQERMAQNLSGDKSGAETLLQLVQKGIASPRLLLSPAISDRLRAAAPNEWEERVKTLTASLPSRNESLDKLIVARKAGFARAQASQERGGAVFTKHCAACHQVDGKGSVVGPQLDGIGNRGLERILEDTLDPNRNVDVAFHVTTIVDNNGKVYSGLFRREEGATVVLVDNQGKEFTVPSREIDERQKSPNSLMPANVAEIMTEAEYYDLVSFLLSKRGKPAADVQK